MSEKLIIVFIKNNQPGKVKTRLAQTIGDQAASEIYGCLVNTTLNCVDSYNADKHIYFSDYLEDESFSMHTQFVQQGKDLGERMLQAFETGFTQGYNQIILIGSDLPDISASIIDQAFKLTKEKDIVLGPAEDGGYYLIGMPELRTKVFQNRKFTIP